MCPEAVLPKHCTYNSLLGSDKRPEVQTVTTSDLKFLGKGPSLTFQQGSSCDTAYWNNTAGRRLNPRTPLSGYLLLTSKTMSACSRYLWYYVSYNFGYKAGLCQLKGQNILSSSLIYHFASVLLRVSTAGLTLPVSL